MDRSHKKHTDDGYDFTSKKIKQEGELEVTGISRSGRVRKKSSKLTDFESLDEIDIRSNSRIKKEKLEQTPTSTVSRPIKKERIVKEEILSDVEDSDLQEGSYPVKQDHYSEESDNDGYPPNEDSSMDSLGSELEEGDDVEMERDDGNGFQPITGDDSSDEASSRQVWKRRANRASVVKKPPGNTNQTRPAILTQTSTVQEQQSNANQTRKVKTSPTRKFLSKPAQPQQHLQQALTPSSQVISTSAASSTVSSDSKAQSKNSFSADSSVFKPVSTSAMDVAAHLKLLGESLTIIGERLTEHEGQIAVSGSFSVLLDSLLCALGPLLCLTQQVPQMNVVPQEQLSQIMDNIAYIMPGL
ncbi:uncharacterized protein isoform X4 [Rhodnius prolixus]|uniref:uncharacterized protein isoform X4 n=1 Tax=Rhodnius prolixus TaxID=13249 RepID=UPI003D1877CB